SQLAVEESGVDEPELGNLELGKLVLDKLEIKPSGGMMCQGMRKEIQTKGVIGDSSHFDTLGDMQEFVKMLVSIITRKTMKLARILDLLNHVILQCKVRCLNRNQGNRSTPTIQR
nr:hypothetical protein [Tanacetum cinerariifolium]